jgi:alpha-L-rhamnosidase
MNDFATSRCAAFLISALAMLSCVPAGRAARATNLRCEYFANPLGIDVEKPRLSWVIESARRGERQTAYQVLVASTPEVLANDHGDLWDSGQVASDQCIQVEYAGKPLRSSARCDWKARVWDKDGQCSAWSQPGEWTMGLLRPQDWQAKWIGYDETPSIQDTNRPAGGKTYLPASYYRKDFTLARQPVQAFLYVTSLGDVEPRLNGHKVGNDFFITGWTDYHKRVYYRCYDVSRELKAGDGTLGAILGDGWFRGNLSIIGQNIYGRKTRLMAQLQLTYEDGSTGVIASDGSWKADFGPVLQTDHFDGETYDGRREIPGWDKPGYNDSAWHPVQTGAELAPVIQAAPGAPVRRTGEVKAVKITEPRAGLPVFDFGQNFAGWVRLRVNAPAGTRVVMRFAEVLNPNGVPYRANLRSARATDTYICRGGGEEVWEPRFTYHGFQYVEVEGLPSKATPETLTGIVVGSDLPPVGSFDCSDSTINRVASNMRWTIRANLFDLPTDCCQRDERMGWMDYHEVAPSTLCEFDASTLFTKWVADIMDARKPDGGFSQISPDVHGFPWSPAWADSSVLIPWMMFRVYGDTRLAGRYYDQLAGHLEFYKSRSKDYVGPDEGYGDWLALDSSTPKNLVSTAQFAQCARAMSELAEALGKTEDAAGYRRLLENIRRGFQKKFINADGTIGSNSQGGYAMALGFDLLDPEQVPQASSRLVAAIEAKGKHLSTGMVTTHLLLPALSKGGRPDVARQLLAQKTFPGWGYFLEQGATSVWERWDSKTEKGFHPDAMNSFNHANLGTCTEWFYHDLAGIQCNPSAVAFKKIIIKPAVLGDLTRVNCSYDSFHGRIITHWKRDGAKLSLDITIPANTAATVFVPAQHAAGVTESGQPAAKAEGVEFLGMQNKTAVYAVGSGTYQFQSTLPETTK